MAVSEQMDLAGSWNHAKSRSRCCACTNGPSTGMSSSPSRLCTSPSGWLRSSRNDEAGVAHQRKIALTSQDLAEREQRPRLLERFASRECHALNSRPGRDASPQFINRGSGIGRWSQDRLRNAATAATLASRTTTSPMPRPKDSTRRQQMSDVQSRQQPAPPRRCSLQSEETKGSSFCSLKTWPSTDS